MKKISHIILSVFLLAIISCKKDYVYEIDDVTVQQEGSDKNNVKSTTEFISIAYSDLFNSTVPTDTLLAIQQAYEAFGDKKLIEDRIIRHFLNSPSIQIPSDSQMRSDMNKFVDDSFRRFFNRKADSFENYFIANIISNDISISPVLVYYAMMTSDEYRYY